MAYSNKDVSTGYNLYCRLAREALRNMDSTDAVGKILFNEYKYLTNRKNFYGDAFPDIIKGAAQAMAHLKKLFYPQGSNIPADAARLSSWVADRNTVTTIARPKSYGLTYSNKNTAAISSNYTHQQVQEQQQVAAGYKTFCQFLVKSLSHNSNPASIEKRARAILSYIQKKHPPTNNLANSSNPFASGAFMAWKDTHYHFFGTVEEGKNPVNTVRVKDWLDKYFPQQKTSSSTATNRYGTNNFSQNAAVADANKLFGGDGELKGMGLFEAAARKVLLKLPFGMNTSPTEIEKKLKNELNYIHKAYPNGKLLRAQAHPVFSGAYRAYTKISGLYKSRNTTAIANWVYPFAQVPNNTPSYANHPASHTQVWAGLDILAAVTRTNKKAREKYLHVGLSTGKQAISLTGKGLEAVIDIANGGAASQGVLANGIPAMMSFLDATGKRTQAATTIKVIATGAKTASRYLFFVNVSYNLVDGLLTSLNPTVSSIDKCAKIGSVIVKIGVAYATTTAVANPFFLVTGPEAIALSLGFYAFDTAGYLDGKGKSGTEKAMVPVCKALRSEWHKASIFWNDTVIAGLPKLLDPSWRLGSSPLINRSATAYGSPYPTPSYSSRKKTAVH
jgi:hypothetical protein